LEEVSLVQDLMMKNRITTALIPSTTLPDSDIFFQAIAALHEGKLGN
jgi:hypothetical protein